MLSADDDFLNMATKLMTSPEKRRYDEGFEDLDGAMAEIPNSLSIPSSNSARKQKFELVNYKDELWSMALAMTGVKTHMELQNNPKLMRLKAEADLIVLLEAAEAKAEAARSKPNPIPTQQQHI